MSATSSSVSSSWPPGRAAQRVRVILGSLSAGEARVARVLLDRGAGVVRLSISEVAFLAGTGIGTVVRACQSLGFRGFRDAKLALAQDVPLTDSDTQGVDAPAEALTTLAIRWSETLRRAPDSVDAAELDRAVEAIRSASRVLLLGAGNSAPAALDAAYQLLSIGVPAEGPVDVHVEHLRARQLIEGDVVVAVSHTGTSRETVDVARAAHEAGASVVAICSFGRTPLTGLSNIVLVAGGRGDRCHVETMTSRLAHRLVLDALVISLVLADQKQVNVAEESPAVVGAEHRS